MSVRLRKLSIIFIKKEIRVFELYFKRFMVRICLIKSFELCRVREISKKLSFFSDRGIIIYIFKIAEGI